MRPENSQLDSGIEFPFELVIRRQGFFLMSKFSYDQWVNEPMFARRVSRQQLIFKPIKLNDFFVYGNNLFYKIEYMHYAEGN